MNKMLITSAGLAEIVNAEQSGTAPVVLSHVAFGSGQYTATADMTALKSEFKRLDGVAGGAIAGNMIHLTVHDNSSDAYTVNEIGVFTAGGTLFAVYSQTTPIIDKSASSETMVAIDIALTDIDPASISFGDTNIILNPATTETAGIVELATSDEAKAGTDTTHAITPAAAKAARDADANIVHRTGNETIAGTKTFNSNVTIESGSPRLNLDQTDITQGTAPTTAQSNAISFRDSQNNTMGYMVHEYLTDGENRLRFAAYKPEQGSTAHGDLSVVYPASGDPYATAPTPAAGDNSTKIATTAWVNTKAANFLPLAGGKMSGSIYKTSDSTRFIVGGGQTYDSGAHIALDGKEYSDGTHAAGSFLVSAHNGTTTKALIGQPDGLLQWNGQNIVRSVNGKNADAAGNAKITADDVDALPTSGGAMTVTKAIYRDVNDSYLGLHGGTGTDNDGAQLDLCGSAHATMPGVFQLHARNGDTDMILRGQTDGKLTWNDKYVLNNSFVASSDSGAIMLTAGTTSTNGAYFRLYGKDHSTGAGTFAIAASNGTTSKSLTGKADGSLTWAGKNLLTKEYYGSEDAESVTINAGSSMYLGARLTLNGILGVGDSGSAAPAGGFALRASSDSTKLYELIGFPDGSLTWNGIDMSAMGMPSDTYVNLTLGSSGSTVTAPADGWFCLDMSNGSGKEQQVALANQAAGNMRAYSCRSISGSGISVIMPCNKGDKIQYLYTATGAASSFRFVYAIGCKHLAS